VYCNIEVTFDTSPNNARSECVLEANPRNSYNMVGASKRFTNPSAYEFSLAAYTTFDAGDTWIEAPPLSLLSGWAGTSDPAIGWDNAGNAYLVALPFGPGSSSPILGIAVYKSTDGGRTWGTPTLIHSSPGDDKQWAAGDTSPASPHYGTVYIVWDNGSQLAFARSNDHGASWRGMGTQPVGTALAFDSFAPVVSVASDGTIYIVWVNGEETGDTIKFVKSTDGGQSFSAPQIAASGITPLKSPPLPKPGSFPELPGGKFRVLTLPDVCTGSGANVLVAWADYREGVSRIYCRHSSNGGANWQGAASGQPLLPAYLNSGADQHDFHPQLARTPSGQIACAFYEFGPKGGAVPLIDVIMAVSSDGGASFTRRDKVTDRAWDPAIDAPLSHGDANTTFIGEYFGLAGSALGFFPLWTDTRTGIQEMFTARPMHLGPFDGVQFRGTVPAGQTHRWFTFRWPACWHVLWVVVPTSPRVGAPQVSWRVQVERASQNYITYWISITNATPVPVDIEARYSILLSD
jgi:hypothetical protein